MLELILPLVPLELIPPSPGSPRPPVLPLSPGKPRLPAVETVIYNYCNIDIKFV